MSKTIIITGGAEGLGKAIAKRLAGKNKVIILDKNEDLLQKTAKELSCEFISCDVSDAKQVRVAIEKILSEYKKVDVLINNAGIWVQGLLEDTDDERIRQTYEANCLGTIFTTKRILPTMKTSDSGTIINIISMAGLMVKTERSVYNSSKWAMTGFTKCLQEELRGTKIRVMGMYPGFMETNLFENAGNSRDNYNVALDPDELAKTIEFILTLSPTTSLNEVSIKNILY